MNRLLITLLLIFFSLPFFSQKNTYENLVFEGAGIRGIAYAGVLKELEDNNILEDINKVGGTSAGAITALMVSIGYNSDEIYSIISKTDFQKFNDGQYMFIGGISRLNSKYGWYKGETFTHWLENIIESKTGNAEMTFEELKAKGFKELYITATCMNKQKLVVFSAENYPKMKIKDAVRISMSIPLYYEAVFIDDEGKVYEDYNEQDNLDIMVDGGIIGNYPIFIFDEEKIDLSNHKIRIPNYKTLGIRIDTDEQIMNDSLSKSLVPMKIENIKDYIESFYVIVLENLNRTPLIPEDWERTISVSSVGISPKVKRLSKAQKQALIKSGEKSTKQFLEHH